MIAAGSRVVTPRGLRKIEDLVVGELVLTHLSRFKPITDTWKRIYEGDACLLRFITTGAAAVISADMDTEFMMDGSGWTSAGTLADIHESNYNYGYVKLAGLIQDDWQHAVEITPKITATEARGTILYVPDGPLVMGIYPDSYIGRVLFRCSPLYYLTVSGQHQYYVGHLYGLDVEEDHTCIAERNIVRMVHRAALG